MELTEHQKEELLWAVANAGKGGWLNDALEERASHLNETQNLDVHRRYQALELLGYVDMLRWADWRTYSARLTEEGRCAAEELISNKLHLLPKKTRKTVSEAVASGAMGLAAQLLLAAL